MPTRLLLFGPPMVEADGESRTLPFERRTQLLVFLALKRAWVGRAELAALLWPELPSKLAYTNLRKTLFRLQALPWAAALQSQGTALRLEIATDVFEFDAALREQRAAAVLPLRRGELLAGFDDHDGAAWTEWLAFERERLGAAWRRAVLERLAGEVAAAEAIALSAHLLDADPLDEAALHAHLTALAGAGQIGRARQAYQVFAARLAEELGIAPGAELKALHDSLGTAVAGASATPSPAPEAGDDFVGRASELRRVAALLAQDDCRLLTLVGPGGVGKTRLAQRAMRELAPGFADGAAFVALEEVADESGIGSRLARELGVRLAGSAEPLAQVIGALRDRQMLLVLDNFEQLAAGAAVLEKILRAAVRLKIVVTSRVRLALSMEWLLALEGLPFPEEEDHDRVEAFDAVRLFLRTARRVAPRLNATAEAAAIVDICRQVEGLPLALELAASWTRVLDCAAIAAELRKGSELLRATDASRPARHASIEMVFDQSWQLLTPAERDALARLSVFRGSFSAEAARAVAATSLPVLGALADKSLLRKDGARMFLHPLVHQFADARLDESTREATHAAHAQYFLRLLAQLRREVNDGERAALQRVDTEFENCRSAWRWAIARGAAEPLMRSALTLQSFCDLRGRFAEGLALLREALAARPAGDDPAFEAVLAGEAAHLEYRLDRYHEAEATAMRALALTRTARDHETRLGCHKVLGGTSLRLGKFDEARHHFNQVLKLAPAGTASASVARTLDALALVEKAQGHYDEALRLTTQALLQHRLAGDAAAEALCLNNLGTLQMDMGELEAAAANLRAALALCERHGLVSTRGAAVANLADIALRTGDLSLAETHARQTLEFGTATSNRTLGFVARLHLARIAARRGDAVAARPEVRAALEIALSIGRPALLTAGLAAFAETLVAQGEKTCARQVLAFAADHPSTGGADRSELQALLASWGEAGPLPPWPGFEVGDLARRVVVETDVAYAPLIAQLSPAR